MPSQFSITRPFLQGLNRLSIGARLGTLIFVMATALLITAALAFFALNQARESAHNLHDQVRETNALTELLGALQKDFVITVNNLNSGMLTWRAADQRVQLARGQFEEGWQALQSSLVDATGEQAAMASRMPAVISAFDTFSALGTNQSRAALELFVLNDLNSLIDPFLSAAHAHADERIQQAEQGFIVSEARLARLHTLGGSTILAGLLIALALGVLIRRSITQPVAVISHTLSQVQQDDHQARTGLQGRDELSRLGATLDQLLDEKMTTLLRIERENEALNESVIELLESAANLAERDLTTRMQVREDITGPLADALNLITREIGEALVRIQAVSELVDSSSELVEGQNVKVIQVAAQERQLVEQTIQKLDSLARQMRQIAQWCQTCNQIAQHAAGSTDKAFGMVSGTIDSMNDIREAISETEKRIKRLSERSQEISGIIDIINSIAERTHVLALNASMQAAAAGDAGRGFAVVADEVQRLAESSRSSTSQISALVRSIQSETADAVNNMNSSISQVVNGSRRAEQAGTQMQETQKTTRELVNAVGKIADNAGSQAKEAELLCQQADRIARSTRITAQELQRQSGHSQRLRTAAATLAQTVAVFQLPEVSGVVLDLPLSEQQDQEDSDLAEYEERLPLLQDHAV